MIVLIIAFWKIVWISCNFLLQTKSIYFKNPKQSAPCGGIIIAIGLSMIKVKPGHEKSVYRQLQGMPEIKDVYRLFGEYSFFLVMQTEGQKKLNKLMVDIEEDEYVIKARPFKLMDSEQSDNISNWSLKTIY